MTSSCVCLSRLPSCHVNVSYILDYVVGRPITVINPAASGMQAWFVIIADHANASVATWFHGVLKAVLHFWASAAHAMSL